MTQRKGDICHHHEFIEYILLINYLIATAFQYNPSKVYADSLKFGMTLKL